MKRLIIATLFALVAGNTFADTCSEQGNNTGYLSNNFWSSFSSMKPSADYYYYACTLDKAITKTNQTGTFNFNHGQDIVQLVYGSSTTFNSKHLTWIEEEGQFKDLVELQSSNILPHEYNYTCKLYYCTKQ